MLKQRTFCNRAVINFGQNIAEVDTRFALTPNENFNMQGL